MKWHLSSGDVIPVVIRKKGELDEDTEAVSLPKLDPTRGNVGETSRQSVSASALLTVFPLFLCLTKMERKQIQV